MSLRRKFLKVLLGLGCLALYAGTGCQRGATPPTPVFGDVQLGVAASTQKGSNQSALATANDPALVSLLGGDVVVDEVRVNLRRADLKPDTESDPGVEYQGPFVVNLVDKGVLVEKATPAFSKVSVPVDTYSEIKFRIDPVSSSELPSGLSGDSVVQSSLIGQTLVVEGRFRESDDHDIDGNGSVNHVPFRFISNMGANLRLEIPGNFQIEQGQTSFVFLVFRLISWLDPALGHLQGLESQDLTDGTVLLVDSSSSDPIRDLVDLIEDAIRGGTKFAESEDDEEFEEEEVEEDSTSEIDFEPEEGVVVPEGEIFLADVRMNLDRFLLNLDPGLEFDGPIVLTLIRDGEDVNTSEPIFSSLGVPAGSYANVLFDFDELSADEIPPGAQSDEVVIDGLVDSTLVVIGEFIESEGNDINGDGEQGFVPFALLSDDFFEAFVTDGVTDDIDSVLFPSLSPYDWFDGALPLLQELNPSLLEEGEFFVLTDSSLSSAIRQIVETVEANLEDALP